MIQFNEQNAECLIFTFKEGLLSAVAHDLKIRVTRFRVELDEEAGRTEAHFDARSLRVVCAMQGGRDDASALSESNRAEIERNIEREVLDAARHPEIHFSSLSIDPLDDGSGARHRVRGTLALLGRARDINVSVEDLGDRQIAEATIHQPDFGIKPYSALLGALKIKPDVKVRLRLPYRVARGR